MAGGQGTAAPVPDLGGREYLFTGVVADRTVEGSLRFLTEGGFAIHGDYGPGEQATCEVTGQRWERWERMQRGTPSLRFSCEDLGLEVELVDGELQSLGTVTIPTTEERETRVRCLAHDSVSGECVRWETRTDRVTVPRRGHVRLTAL